MRREIPSWAVHTRVNVVVVVPKEAVYTRDTPIVEGTRLLILKVEVLEVNSADIVAWVIEPGTPTVYVNTDGSNPGTGFPDTCKFFNVATFAVFIQSINY